VACCTNICEAERWREERELGARRARTERVGGAGEAGVPLLAVDTVPEVKRDKPATTGAAGTCDCAELSVASGCCEGGSNMSIKFLLAMGRPAAALAVTSAPRLVHCPSLPVTVWYRPPPPVLSIVFRRGSRSAGGSCAAGVAEEEGVWTVPCTEIEPRWAG
jgi:hypothetical protein